MPKVAITGGAGYVGSALVPHLARLGYDVRVVDLFWYGRDFLENLPGPGKVELLEADIRDGAALREAFRGTDAVLHLACISNDPSFELDPGLGRSINLEAFPKILEAVRANGVGRFVYASSSSVYGVKEVPDVTEDTPCDPLTDYSRFKLECETMLAERGIGDGCYTIIRPATVCGWAPRLRLDLTVNILTIHALVNRRIRVFGGAQLRPNINIGDMVAAYQLLLESPREKVDRQVFNVGYENRSVMDLALEVQSVVGGDDLTIVTEPTNDMRSYHISSQRIRQVLGFEPRYNIQDAVRSICDAYHAGRIPDAMTDDRYYNVKRMQHLNLSARQVV
jgi:nucleoside-diphosphate-sugar epimerase